MQTQHYLSFLVDKFGHYRLIMVQLLSLTKWIFLFIFQSSMTIFHYKYVRDVDHTRLKMDEVEVSWDESTCKLVHNKCH